MDVSYAYRMEDFEEISEAADKVLKPNARRVRKAYLFLGIALIPLPFLAGASLRHPDVKRTNHTLRFP